MKKVNTFILFLCLSVTVFSQTWNSKADFLDCRYDGVTFAIEDTVYYGLGITCFGGESLQFFKYVPSLDTWSPIAPFPGNTRRKGSAFSINGKGYVGIGYSSGVSLQDFWEYDPVVDAWTQKANFLGTPRGAAIANVVNNKGYIGPGFGPGSVLYPMDLWEYDPSNDSWTVKATMPGIALYNSSTFAIGDTLYVPGGIGGAILLPHNEFWAYSVSSDTWTQKANIPGFTRHNPTTFSLHGLGYYGYGSNSFVYSGDFYSYDPTSGSWTTVVSNGTGGMLFNGGGGGTATTNAGYCISGVVSAVPSPSTTDTWEFMPGTTNIIETQNGISTSLSIFPNPNNTGEFLLSERSITSIEVLNSIGQIVFSRTYSGGNIQKMVTIKNEPNGVYFVRVASNGKWLTGKVVLHR